MPELSDSEIFSGVGPAKEGHEQSFEQFQEDQKRTQQALAQLWKEEGKAKAQDNQLAQIIVQFLNDPQNTHLFLLIARVVSQNIPSEFIIAIVSLIDARAERATEFLLSAPTGGTTGQTGASAIQQRSLTVYHPASLSSIPPELKGRIDQWTQKINRVALNMPHETLATVMEKPHDASGGRRLSSVVLQLCSVVLRDFLKKHDIHPEFEAIYELMQTILVEIMKNVESLLADQKQLAGK